MLKRVKYIVKLAFIILRDLYSNLNGAVVFLIKGLMPNCLLPIVNIVPIGDLYIFGIHYGVERTFVFSWVDIEKRCLISLTIKPIKIFLL